MGPVSAGWCNRYSVSRRSLRELDLTWQSLLIVYAVPLVHEVKLLYVRYDALMNATDVWEDMNMICKYIDEVHNTL